MVIYLLLLLVLKRLRPSNNINGEVNKSDKYTNCPNSFKRILISCLRYEFDNNEEINHFLFGYTKYPGCTFNLNGGVLTPEGRVVLSSVDPVNIFVNFISFTSNNLKQSPY
jgi:hypothetical protein